MTFVTYFDEIKPDAKLGRHEYVVGGLVIPFGHIKPLEKAVGDLAVEIFGTSEMTPSTEFHAAHIYFGKGAFKGRPTQQRIEVLGRLGAIIHDAREQGVGQVYTCANSDLMHSTDPAKAAFAFFCERVQGYVGRNADTLLIGDLDGEESRQMIRDFSKYRIDGKTPWDYGAPIPSIVDSVHFAHSHHSRLLQLADAYLLGNQEGLDAEFAQQGLRGTKLLSAPLQGMAETSLSGLATGCSRMSASRTWVNVRTWRDPATSDQIADSDKWAGGAMLAGGGAHEP